MTTVDSRPGPEELPSALMELRPGASAGDDIRILFAAAHTYGDAPSFLEDFSPGHAGEPRATAQLMSTETRDSTRKTRDSTPDDRLPS